MKTVLVSPYHGGSHKAWAEGYKSASNHNVVFLTLPDRFWKWRMHGGAVTLARRFLAEWTEMPDLVMATDMLDLSTFAALTRHQLHDVPLALYMHENQLTYPLPEDGQNGPMRRQLGERDQHYAFVNYASMLTADLILFNSYYHLNSFFPALHNFLKHFPEYNELGTVDALRQKSEVLPVGVDFGRLELRHLPPSPSDQPPLIIWNQRWEYDKNAEAFFAALDVLAEEGVSFRLALCGQQFGQRPLPFQTALSKLSTYIIHAGYADLDTYRRLLWEAAVTVSTAHHEFFGISILEAVGCRTLPILPHRLSYPELIPEPYHLRCLYENQGGLVQRLRWALTHVVEAGEIAADLATAVHKYDWSQIAPQYDARLDALLS
jgi:glycosyltransferase involved in cell wall biosynthesis